MSVEPSASQANRSRAGRDLRAAVTVAVALVAVIVVSLVYAKASFLLVVGAAILVGLWEFGRALALNGVWMPVPPMAAGALGMIAGSYYGGPDVLVAVLAATVLASMLWRMSRGSGGFLRDVSATVFCLVYLPFLASFAALLLAPADGVNRVLTFIGVTIASDTGGYAVGASIGRHPMAPTVSPNKSWEGFAGSALACMAAGAAFIVYLFDEDWWIGLVLGGVVAVAATLGDLAESLIKRDLGIKDMSNLLPGHGGVMDRLDSLLAAVAVVYLVLHFLVPVT